jgi:LysR family transcriptional regulator for bpeEF and oprC
VTHTEQQLAELHAFVAVVEHGGFSAAARASQGRTTSFSRSVHALEARLGVPLIERTSRTLRLTDEGRACYEHAARALSTLRDAEAVAVASRAVPRGVLRVTTSSALTTFVLEEVVPAYLAAHASVRVEVASSDERSDFAAAGFDLAIWTGKRATTSAARAHRLEDPTMPWSVHPLGVVGMGFFASPAYLATRTMPRSVEGLAAHDTIAVTRGAAPAEWAMLVDGVRETVTLRPRLIVDDVQRAVRAAAQGLGIVRAPALVAAPFVARGELVGVMEAMAPPGLDAFVVLPPRAALIARTRAFVATLEMTFPQ